MRGRESVLLVWWKIPASRSVDSDFLAVCGSDEMRGMSVEGLREIIW